jgi:heat shock protein beta
MRLLSFLSVLSYIAIAAFGNEVIDKTISATPQLSTTDLEGKLESFEFQAEVNRMLDIIINSLYQNKDIFLRELISNASDALDKIRYLALSAPELLEAVPELNVHISANAEERTLTIRDTGVGMTKQDLIEHLGTIAKSGTSAFMEQLAGSDSNLIGQFGVGFYSVYLVADKVRVISKNSEDDQWIWESTADENFKVAKDPRGNTLGRGTEITLFLKDDASQFLEVSTLRDLIKRYSEFITFPIYLRTSTDEEYEVPLEESEETDEKKEGDDEEVEATEEATGDETKEEEKKEAATKKETRTIWDWEHINNQKAIWSRSREEITDDEYMAFYKSITKDETDPISWTHFKAEGEIEFRGILYVPSKNDPEFYDKYYQTKSKIKLYVKKVLITDEVEDFVPRYLNFVSGVVDSDDLPLNVSRETLQQHKVLKIMGKKITRKVIEMLRSIAKGESADAQKEEEDSDDKKSEDKKDFKDNEKYIKFWKEFGKNIKLGVIEDLSNKTRLSKLLRFYSTHTGREELTSLEAYVSRMKEWQKDIYFIAGETYESIENSQFLEKFRAKGLEVLLLTEAVDEYVVQHLTEFDDKKLVSITKEGVKFGDEDDSEKRREEKYKDTFKPLTSWMKELLSSKVEKVSVTSRLETTPALLVTSQWGYSANMERLMKSQAFGDPTRAQFLVAKKTMEINPRHPIVAELLERVKKDKESSELKDLAWLLYDTALLNSGFSMDESKDFSSRMYRLMQRGLELESLDLQEPIEVPAEEKEAEDEEDEDFEDFEEEL